MFRNENIFEKHFIQFYLNFSIRFADVRGLQSVPEVTILREKVYTILEEYNKATHPNEPGRFSKLLLRLPSLRSIGLKLGVSDPLFVLKKKEKKDDKEKTDYLKIFLNELYEISSVPNTS